MANHIYLTISKTLFGLAASAMALAANASLLDCTKPSVLLSGQECVANDNLPRVNNTQTPSEKPEALPLSPSEAADFHVNQNAQSEYGFLSFPIIGVLLLILLVRARSFNSK